MLQIKMSQASYILPLLVVRQRFGIVWVCYNFVPFQTDPVERIRPVATIQLSPAILMS